jgi:DNA-binding NarL/FixJ family response regulator
MHEDMSMITGMIEAGASGYLLKRTSMNEVLEAIRVVASKGKYLGREVQSILMERMSSKDQIVETSTAATTILSIREKEILNLVSKELSNEEIANRLFISERTVETHRRNIFTKTKTKSIVGLIKYAIKSGLVSQDPN